MELISKVNTRLIFFILKKKVELRTTVFDNLLSERLKKKITHNTELKEIFDRTNQNKSQNQSE